MAFLFNSHMQPDSWYISDSMAIIFWLSGTFGMEDFFAFVFPGVSFVKIVFSSVYFKLCGVGGENGRSFIIKELL